MYKDFISYKLAEGISKEHLLKITTRIGKEWLKKQKGFVSWTINEEKDGSFIDLVCWQSKEHAKVAKKNMQNIKKIEEWCHCYKKNRTQTKNVKEIFSI